MSLLIVRLRSALVGDCIYNAIGCKSLCHNLVYLCWSFVVRTARAIAFFKWIWQKRIVIAVIAMIAMSGGLCTRSLGEAMALAKMM